MLQICVRCSPHVPLLLVMCFMQHRILYIGISVFHSVSLSLITLFLSIPQSPFILWSYLGVQYKIVSMRAMLVRCLCSTPMISNFFWISFVWDLFKCTHIDTYHLGFWTIYRIPSKWLTYQLCINWQHKINQDYWENSYKYDWDKHGANNTTTNRGASYVENPSI